MFCFPFDSFDYMYMYFLNILYVLFRLEMLHYFRYKYRLDGHFHILYVQLNRPHICRFLHLIGGCIPYFVPLIIWLYLCLHFETFYLNESIAKHRIDGIVVFVVRYRLYHIVWNIYPHWNVAIEMQIYANNQHFALSYADSDI